MNERYRHTQVGWTLIVLVVAVVLAELTIVALSAPQGTLALALSGALVAIALVMLALFSTLTVVVDDRAVKLWFGWGSLRREVMLAALDRHLPAGCSWTKPDGGLFLWATLPRSIDTADLLRAAAREKIAFVPGAPFWVGEPVRNTLRLNFSNASESAIREGIARLGAVVRAALA